MCIRDRFNRTKVEDGVTLVSLLRTAAEIEPSKLVIPFSENCLLYTSLNEPLGITRGNNKMAQEKYLEEFIWV